MAGGGSITEGILHFSRSGLATGSGETYGEIMQKMKYLVRSHTHTHALTYFPPIYIHLQDNMSGSLSSNSGMAAIHLMGLEHTGNVSSTSPTAAASRILTWEEEDGGRKYMHENYKADKEEKDG